MKYMLLVHHDQEAHARRSESERADLLHESVQLANQLHASGKYLGAAPLHPSSVTTCARIADRGLQIQKESLCCTGIAITA